MAENENTKEPRDRDDKRWQLWDHLLTFGIFSLLSDNEEASKSDENFRRILFQWTMSAVMAGVLFVIIWFLYGLMHGR
ncbi:hypothetical protein [Ectobacillus ponti]|uniref:Uncharacterized protein n=1 Tax=Ectobacillus ponti TaxID=2961894 RepID=A0AA41X8R5_9BACI|nr:hypothetical protein [Ectobacillus ponti]MCP8968460.1 hypothetical protein [Ectobacillus ponti]